jgi:putative ATP-dependent endonuclease of OLD family
VAAVGSLLDLALESEEEQRINDQLKSASNNIVTLPIVRAEILKGSLSSEVRAALGSASGKKKTGWFKNVSTMEYIARHVVAPRTKEVDVGFSQLFVRVRKWCIGA